MGLWMYKQTGWAQWPSEEENGLSRKTCFNYWHNTGRLEVDLFALPTSHHFPHFFTRFHPPAMDATVAVMSTWPRLSSLCLPPIPFIPKMISIVRQQKANMLVVAPLDQKTPVLGTKGVGNCSAICLQHIWTCCSNVQNGTLDLSGSS